LDGGVNYHTITLNIFRFGHGNPDWLAPRFRQGHRDTSNTGLTIDFHECLVSTHA
jgi:hypothetical protein